MDTISALSFNSLLVLACLWLSGCCLAESAPMHAALRGNSGSNSIDIPPRRLLSRRLLASLTAAKEPRSSTQRTKPSPQSRRSASHPKSPKPQRPPKLAKAAAQQQPSSRPPSPPPPSLPNPVDSVEVCSGMTLVSPLDKSGKPVYTFGNPVACDDVAEFMSENWAAAAAARGARLASPFALRSCSGQSDTSVTPPSPPSIVVCGTFASVPEASMLQDDLPALMSAWKRYVLGLPLPDPTQPRTYHWCPPRGYDIASFVWGDGEKPPLMAYERVQC